MLSQSFALSVLYRSAAAQLINIEIFPMKYLDQISDLIHHKGDYECSIIQELLSNKGLSQETQDLLR